MTKVQRNDYCSCKSGLKFKRCCGKPAPAKPRTPPPDLSRIARATGFKDGDTYCLADVADRVEAMVAQEEKDWYAPHCSTCSCMREKKDVAFRPLTDD